MDSVAIWLEALEEESCVTNERIDRRVIRNSSNIMCLSERSFIKNFRLSKEAFVYVLNEISGELGTSSRSFAITPETKLATALKFLGQGGYQHQIGQDRNTGLAQPTVSICLKEVCTAIEKILCPKHISFNMTEAEKRMIKEEFFEKCGIPGVIGAIDGTHIQIIRPKETEHLFLNRKLKHSMNAMVICDHKMRIRAVDAKFGGSSHDAHIWNLSVERQYLKNCFDNGDRSSWLLGDSGYPLEPWLMTPYRNPDENSEESFFNSKFVKGRVIIEQTFGMWKGRFRCLLAARQLHYKPTKVVQIVNSCAALHNICIEFKVPQPERIADEEAYIELAENNLGSNTGNYQRIALNIRNQIKRNLYR